MENLSKKLVYYVPTVLLIAALFTAGFQYKKAYALKLSVENNYNRAFFELADCAEAIEANLQKIALVSSPEQSASISAELFEKTAAAKACLAQLPLSGVLLENTEKFLSQTGDYTYLLSQKNISGEESSDEDYEKLRSLAEYSSVLREQLSEIRDDVYSGEIRIGDLKKSSEKLLSTAEAAASDVLSDFERVEKQFTEYPSLIYDGPFSEHIQKINPVMTENAVLLSRDKVAENAAAFLGERGKNLLPDGESENTPFAAYLFKSANDYESVYTAFTKKGGYPLYFLVSREPGEEAIGIDEAISAAKEFLSERGFSSMKESYYDTSGGIATINFAYMQGNVVCYSDLIKVKVALDNGEIVGFEANGYLSCHKQRDVSGIAISEAEAKSKVNRHLSVDGVSLAIIPKNNKTEILCYEVKGTHAGKNFLIYINAENGREEKIMLLIETDNGVLTV